MKTKLSSPKILNIVLCIVILVVFVLTIGNRINTEILTDNISEVVPLGSPIGYKYQKLNIKFENKLTEEELTAQILNLDYYLQEYEETIKFYSKLFDYNYEDIVNDLRNSEKNNESFEATNLGYLKDSENNLKTYPNVEYGLIEYFYELNEIKTISRQAEYRPYAGKPEYVVNLIQYFADIYDNVDKNTLLGIGAAESGHYKVKYMLKNNNVYGGMSSKGLIRHNNIELGVLSFVRLMSRNYYGKGLSTLQEIGRVYCPVYINGVKQARPHWIYLVTNTKDKYASYTNTITIDNLIEWKERV